MSDCILKRQGYSSEVDVRHPYKGNKGYSTVIRASKDGIRYYLFKVPFWQVGHYQRIIQIQAQLKMVPKLSHLTESIFLVEECGGTLLWEADDNTQFSDQLPGALDEFLDSLRRVDLVHGDIRPWNIFYKADSKEFKIIDWGFSFFAGENLSEPPFWHLRDHLRSKGHQIENPFQIDRTDAIKTQQVVMGTLRYEDAWHHSADEMEWRPRWAAR